MSFRILLLLMAIALWRPCDAQSSAQIVREFDSIANPPMARNDALRFDATEADLGQMSEDDAPRTCRFVFSNVSKTPVVITRVSSSCGCAQPLFSREPILAGGKAEIEVTFKPKGHPGKLIRHVYVYTNASSVHPSVRLTLKGEVTPTADQWQAFRVQLGTSLKARRNKLTFRGMSRTQIRTERIECVNTGTTPLRLQAMGELLPDFISFRTDPEVIAPSQTADLIVTVDGSRYPAAFGKDREWVVLIEGVVGKPSQRSLHIETEFID